MKEQAITTVPEEALRDTMASQLDHALRQLGRTKAVRERSGGQAYFGGGEGQLIIDERFVKGMEKVVFCRYDALAQTGEGGRELARVVVDTARQEPHTRQ